MSDDPARRDDDPVRDDDAVAADRAAADDRAAVDRAFAELVAGYHLTADRPEPPAWDRRDLDRGPEAGGGTGDDPPVFDGTVFEPPRPLPEDHVSSPSIESDPEDRYEPGPPPPMPRPAWPVLVGWIGLGYAMLTVLLIAVRVPLPAWAAWAGVIGFVGGFGLLVSRLPRQRPPDAGDGAVL
jgi:hypothetical protein